VIIGKNQKFWLSKTIFSVNFILQMYQIFANFKLEEDLDYKKYINMPSEKVDQIP